MTYTVFAGLVLPVSLARELNATLAVALAGFPHCWCVHNPWSAAHITNAASALALPSCRVELPIVFFSFPWAAAAVSRSSPFCVVRPAAWLLLFSIFGLELGEAVSRARNSLGHQAGGRTW